MYVNALVQYNSDAKQWSSNVRFNFIHRPFSDFDLVFNERRHSVTGDLIDRALVAKFTYLTAFQAEVGPRMSSNPDRATKVL